jgi:hypothetical protein
VSLFIGGAYSLISFFLESLSEMSIEIERVRAQMIQLGDEYGLMHPKVHQCSNQLDILLLHYYELDRLIRLLPLD